MSALLTSTTLTGVAFAALVIVLVVRHLRRSRREERARQTQCHPCPRCRTPLATGLLTCPTCRVPLKAFEVIAAPRAAPPTAAPSALLHALVRADVCVGCGTCVDACPEAGAIRIEHKRAIIDDEKCKAHGSCVAACPVGAILLSTDAAVQRVTVPDLDYGFQSNIPGIYVVGELGGRGLIKNAINEGAIAIERITEELRGASRLAGVYDVLIVGSGPAGMSAALAAKRRGLSAVVLERGTLADSIRKYPRHKLLLAEPVRVPLYGELWVADASKEDLLTVWESMVRERAIDLRPHHEVTDVHRSGDLFLVEAAGKGFHARRVVLAMGRRGNPRRLGVPGEDLPKVFYDIIEMETFAQRRVLVVGGGDSAVESAVGLAHQPGATVTLSYRGAAFQRVKDRNLSKLDEADRAGKLTVLLGSQVQAIQPDSVTLDVAGERRELGNDDVIVRIGGEPPFAFLERLGVGLVVKEVPLTSAGSHHG